VGESYTGGLMTIVWQVSGTQAEHFIEVIYKHLSPRRKKQIDKARKRAATFKMRQAKRSLVERTKKAKAKWKERQHNLFLKD